MVNLRNLATLLVALVPFGAAAPAADAPIIDDHQPDEALLAAIKDKYFVTFKTGVEKREIDKHVAWVSGVQKRNLSGRNLTGVEQSFDFHDFHAYTGHFDEETLDEIKNDPSVEAVEPDMIFSLDAFVQQPNAPWGLQTISGRKGQGFYRYDDSAGRDRWAYVIDSGIRISHNEFGGRAARGYNALPIPFDDTFGHGTHVAGIIAGRTYGVAKAANLVDVKVFDGRDTTLTAIMEGVVWAAWDILNRGRTGRAVLNMSFGAGARSTVFDNAIAAIYDQGTLCVVASGNFNIDASLIAPAGAPRAMTVGAIDADWNEAYFSNYGTSVNIMAPGVNILSAGHSSNSATATMSGTSMAAPHVAGVVLYLSRLLNIGDPATLQFYLLFSTQFGVRSRKSGSPDRVVYNRANI